MIASSIWLECADDIALARKLSALAQMSAGNKGFADFVFGWLQAYESFTRRALAVQRDRVKPTADYRIQAEVESAEVLSSSILALKAHI
jgi:hypothetical protein